MKLEGGLWECPIIRTDSQIRTLFRFVLMHPPTPKSKLSRKKKKYVHFRTSILRIYFLRNFVSTDNTMPLYTRKKLIKNKKRFKEILNKNSISGCGYFFLRWESEHLVFWTLFGFVNPYVILDAPSLRRKRCIFFHIDQGLPLWFEAHLSMTSTPYMARDWGDGAIPSGGGLLVAAWNNSLTIRLILFCKTK